MQRKPKEAYSIGEKLEEKRKTKLFNKCFLETDRTS